MESIHLNKEACFVSFFFLMKMTRGNQLSLRGTNQSQPLSVRGKQQNCFAGYEKKEKEKKKGTVWFPFQLWAYDWLIQTCPSAAHGFDPGQNTLISLWTGTALLYVFLLFQLGSATVLGSTGRSGGERESWGDFWACGERGSSSGGGLSGWKGLL